MSCLLAYLGPTTSLRGLLLDAPHDLFGAVGENPGALGACAALGFGVGWYGNDGRPAMYLNPNPIGRDRNIGDLARCLGADLWMAGSGPVDPSDIEQAGEFCLLRGPELLFMHCGLVQGYRTRLRPAIRDFLPPEVESGIVGATAGEHLFTLLTHLLDTDPKATVPGAMAELYELVDDWMGNREGCFDLLATDGGQLCAGRHAVHMSSEPLFYTTDDEDFPGAQVIASEPLTDSDFWHSLPDDSILVLDPEQPAELMSLTEPGEG